MAKETIIYLPSIKTDEIDAQLALWRQESPDMAVLAMLPEAEKAEVTTLQVLCRSRQIPLFGAIFPQLVFGAEFRCSGVCLLRFDSMPYAV